MILKEGWCDFNTEDLKFLELVGSDKFPWYLAKTTPNFHGMVHTLMTRSEKQTRGLSNSQYAPVMEDIFMRLCERNNIRVDMLYRMSFNLTFADPSKHGDPHIDHPDFPHNNLLIYLNQFDAGETFLLNENRSIKDTIHPAVDKFAVFNGCLHAQGFCRPQQVRQVFVATFAGEVL